MPGEARCFELPISLFDDELISAFEAIYRSDVADPTVEPHIVILVHEAGYDPPSIIHGERHTRADALPFERLVPPFDLPIALGIER